MKPSPSPLIPIPRQSLSALRCPVSLRRVTLRPRARQPLFPLEWDLALTGANLGVLEDSRLYRRPPAETWAAFARRLAADQAQPDAGIAYGRQAQLLAQDPLVRSAPIRSSQLGLSLLRRPLPAGDSQRQPLRAVVAGLDAARRTTAVGVVQYGYELDWAPTLEAAASAELTVQLAVDVLYVLHQQRGLGLGKALARYLAMEFWSVLFALSAQLQAAAVTAAVAPLLTAECHSVAGYLFMQDLEHATAELMAPQLDSGLVPVTELCADYGL